MIELRNVSKIYVGNGGKEAVKNINLTLPRGEIVGLFGENGAGKTTLMKCILDLISFDGTITLDGEKIGRKNIEKLSFGTCEHSFFPGLTAKGHRDFYEDHFETFSKERFEILMDFFQLPLHRPIRFLSTGQKNQFEVIMALSQGADYILLDEPFAGNDIFNREDFYKLLVGLLEPHETVILSTHLIEEVRNFISRAILIHKGELIGDQQMSQLEEEGMDLMTYVRKTYSYSNDRVIKALTELGD